MPGRWKLQGSHQIRIEIDSGNVQPFTLEILSCENDLLRVQNDKRP
jgi:hypothetical protein